MQRDLLGLKFFDKLRALGLQHGADHFVDWIAERYTHAPLELGMKQPFEIFWHRALGEQVLVVSKTDIGFTRDRPKIQAPLALLFGFLRVGGKMGGMIGAQEKSIAHEHQIAFGGFHRVGYISLRLGFFEHSCSDVRARDSIGLDFYSWVLGFECFDHRFIRVTC